MSLSNLNTAINDEQDVLHEWYRRHRNNMNAILAKVPGGSWNEHGTSDGKSERTNPTSN